MTKKSSKSANTALKDKDNNIVFERERILKRWTEYISGLFNYDRAEEIPLTNISSEQLDGGPILLSEIRNALKNIKMGEDSGGAAVPQCLWASRH